MSDKDKPKEIRIIDQLDLTHISVGPDGLELGGYVVKEHSELAPVIAPTSTMAFDDANQPMIWRDRKECEGMTHPEIVAALEAEAEEQGYEPMDRNWAGTPNVYLRGRYGSDRDKPDEEPKWIEDGFVMFVRKAERS